MLHFILGKPSYSTNISPTSTNTKDVPSVDDKTHDGFAQAVTQEQDEYTDNFENLSDDEKMIKILEGANNKELKIGTAAKIFVDLATKIPIELVQPLFQEANREINNKTNKGRIIIANLDKLEVNMESETNVHATHENKMVNSIIKVLNTIGSARINGLEILTMIQVVKLGSTKLGLHEGNCFAVRNIENGLTWKARHSSIKEVCSLLTFSGKRKTQSNEHKVAVTLFEETIKNIEMRWVEITSAKDFASLLQYYPRYLSEHFVQKVEDRITESVETMSVEDLELVLKMLGIKKRRHLPLLRAISYHLLKRRDELDLKQLSDLLFAFNQLNFRDLDILEGLCNVAELKLGVSDIGDLSKITEQQQVMLIRSLLTSLGQLKFRHIGLLDCLCALLTSKVNNEENVDGCNVKTKDLAAFLLATATLDYCPKNSSKLYEAVIQNITQDNIENDAPGKLEATWLNIVWSLVILNKAPHNCLESVLNSDFYNKLLYAHDHRNVHVMLKLLNINAAASLDSTYKGPTIEIMEDPLLKDVKSATLRDKSSFIIKAMDDFSKFACPPTFLVPNINTLMGFQIEGEAVFDRNGKAVPIAGYSILGDNSNNSNSPLKTLPEGATRVAVMCVGYHDCLADGITFSGATSLYLRLLESKMKVFCILHNYSKPQQNTLDRVRMLDTKLKMFLFPTPPTE